MRFSLYLTCITCALFPLLSSCSELDDPAVSIPTESIITVRAFFEDTTGEVSSIPADSNSYILIKAIIGEKLAPSQSIAFSTTEGLLTLPGAPVSTGEKILSIEAAYRDAIVVLHSGKIPSKKVLISATVDSYLDVFSFEFSNAYPEQININPSVISVSSSDTVNVVINAIRNSGITSDGVVYDIRYLGSDSIPLNLPNYGVLNNQQGSFSIINPLEKVGSIQVQIAVPISETDSVYKVVKIKYL